MNVRWASFHDHHSPMAAIAAGDLFLPQTMPTSQSEHNLNVATLNIKYELFCEAANRTCGQEFLCLHFERRVWTLFAGDASQILTEKRNHFFATFGSSLPSADVHLCRNIFRACPKLFTCYSWASDQTWCSVETLDWRNVTCYSPHTTFTNKTFVPPHLPFIPWRSNDTRNSDELWIMNQLFQATCVFAQKRLLCRCSLDMQKKKKKKKKRKINKKTVKEQSCSNCVSVTTPWWIKGTHPLLLHLFSGQPEVAQVCHEFLSKLLSLQSCVHNLEQTHRLQLIETKKEWTLTKQHRVEWLWPINYVHFGWKHPHKPAENATLFLLYLFSPNEEIIFMRKCTQGNQIASLSVSRPTFPFVVSRWSYCFVFNFSEFQFGNHWKGQRSGLLVEHVPCPGGMFPVTSRPAELCTSFLNFIFLLFFHQIDADPGNSGTEAGTNRTWTWWTMDAWSVAENMDARMIWN